MEEVGCVVPRTAVPAECESVLVKESVLGAGQMCLLSVLEKRV